MVSIMINFASLCGLLLIILALLLPILACLERPLRGEKLLQDFVLGTFYFFSGGILLVCSGQFDPTMQFSQVVLVSSILYWVVKDHRS